MGDLGGWVACWWELRRLAVVIVVVDVLVTLASLGLCLAIGAMNREGVGTTMFVAAVVMAFCSAGIGGGPVRTALPFDQRLEHGSALLESRQTALEATSRTRNIQNEIDQFRNVSWTMALAIASVTLMVISALIILA